MGLLDGLFSDPATLAKHRSIQRWAHEISLPDSGEPSERPFTDPNYYSEDEACADVLKKFPTGETHAITGPSLPIEPSSLSTSKTLIDPASLKSMSQSRRFDYTGYTVAYARWADPFSTAEGEEAYGFSPYALDAVPSRGNGKVILDPIDWSSFEPNNEDDEDQSDSDNNGPEGPDDTATSSKAACSHATHTSTAANAQALPVQLEAQSGTSKGTAALADAKSGVLKKPKAFSKKKSKKKVDDHNENAKQQEARKIRKSASKKTKKNNEQKPIDPKTLVQTSPKKSALKPSARQSADTLDAPSDKGKPPDVIDEHQSPNADPMSSLEPAISAPSPALDDDRNAAPEAHDPQPIEEPIAPEHQSKLLHASDTAESSNMTPSKILSDDGSDESTDMCTGPDQQIQNKQSSEVSFDGEIQTSQLAQDMLESLPQTSSDQASTSQPVESSELIITPPAPSPPAPPPPSPPELEDMFEPPPPDLNDMVPPPPPEVFSPVEVIDPAEDKEQATSEGTTDVNQSMDEPNDTTQGEGESEIAFTAPSASVNAKSIEADKRPFEEAFSISEEKDTIPDPVVPSLKEPGETKSHAAVINGSSSSNLNGTREQFDGNKDPAKIKASAGTAEKPAHEGNQVTFVPKETAKSSQESFTEVQDRPSTPDTVRNPEDVDYDLLSSPQKFVSFDPSVKDPKGGKLSKKKNKKGAASKILKAASQSRKSDGAKAKDEVKKSKGATESASNETQSTESVTKNKKGRLVIVTRTSKDAKDNVPKKKSSVKDLKRKPSVKSLTDKQVGKSILKNGSRDADTSEEQGSPTSKDGLITDLEAPEVQAKVDISSDTLPDSSLREKYAEDAVAIEVAIQEPHAEDQYEDSAKLELGKSDLPGDTDDHIPDSSDLDHKEVDTAPSQTSADIVSTHSAEPRPATPNDLNESIGVEINPDTIVADIETISDAPDEPEDTPFEKVEIAREDMPSPVKAGTKEDGAESAPASSTADVLAERADLSTDISPATGSMYDFQSIEDHSIVSSGKASIFVDDSPVVDNQGMDTKAPDESSAKDAEENASIADDDNVESPSANKNVVAVEEQMLEDKAVASAEIVSEIDADTSITEAEGGAGSDANDPNEHDVATESLAIVDMDNSGICLNELLGAAEIGGSNDGTVPLMSKESTKPGDFDNGEDLTPDLSLEPPPPIVDDEIQDLLETDPEAAESLSREAVLPIITETADGNLSFSAADEPITDHDQVAPATRSHEQLVEVAPAMNVVIDDPKIVENDRLKMEEEQIIKSSDAIQYVEAETVEDIRQDDLAAQTDSSSPVVTAQSLPPFTSTEPTRTEAQTTEALGARTQADQSENASTIEEGAGAKEEIAAEAAPTLSNSMLELECRAANKPADLVDASAENVERPCMEPEPAAQGQLHHSTSAAELLNHALIDELTIPPPPPIDEQEMVDAVVLNDVGSTMISQTIEGKAAPSSIMDGVRHLGEDRQSWKADVIGGNLSTSDGERDDERRRRRRRRRRSHRSNSFTAESQVENAGFARARAPRFRPSDAASSAFKGPKLGVLFGLLQRSNSSAPSSPTRTRDSKAPPLVEHRSEVGQRSRRESSHRHGYRHDRRERPETQHSTDIFIKHGSRNHTDSASNPKPRRRHTSSYSHNPPVSFMSGALFDTSSNASDNADSPVTSFSRERKSAANENNDMNIKEQKTAAVALPQPGIAGTSGEKNEAAHEEYEPDPKVVKDNSLLADGFAHVPAIDHAQRSRHKRHRSDDRAITDAEPRLKHSGRNDREKGANDRRTYEISEHNPISSNLGKRHKHRSPHSRSYDADGKVNRSKSDIASSRTSHQRYKPRSSRDQTRSSAHNSHKSDRHREDDTHPDPLAQKTSSGSPGKKQNKPEPSQKKASGNRLLGTLRRKLTI